MPCRIGTFYGCVQASLVRLMGGGPLLGLPMQPVGSRGRDRRKCVPGVRRLPCKKSQNGVVRVGIWANMACSGTCIDVSESDSNSFSA